MEKGWDYIMGMQLRRGNEADLDKTKMLPAEGVATLDTKKIFYCFAPDNVEQMATVEEMNTAITEVTADVVAQATVGINEVITNAEIATKNVTDVFDEANSALITANNIIDTVTQTNYGVEEAESLRVLTENKREDDITGETYRKSNEKLRQEFYNAYKECKPYNETKAYVIGNKATYQGGTYQCILNCTGVSPTYNNDNDNWVCIAAKGTDGNGGDMYKSTYDITNKGIDIYNYSDDNIAISNKDTVGSGVLYDSGLEVSAQSTPDMTISVSTGIVYLSNGKRFTPDTTSLTITPSDTENPRIDIIYVDSNGVISYLAGTPSATPTAPSLPSGAILLAEINVNENVIRITSNDVIDKRTFIKTNVELSNDIYNINHRVINPDNFDGTDAEKLQQAINKSITDLTASIVLTRIYDITGNTLYIDKTFATNSVTDFIGIGGGIKKTDSGYMFSSTIIYPTGQLIQCGNIKFTNFEIYGQNGSSVKFLNGDAFYNVQVKSCMFYDLDYVVYSDIHYIQSYYFNDCHVYRCYSCVLSYLTSYDLTWKNCSIDASVNGIIQTTVEATSNNPNPSGAGNNNIRIIDSLFEGMSGQAIKLGFVSVGQITGNYFEENEGYIDVSSNPSYGLEISNNFFHDTDSTKVAIYWTSHAIASVDYQDKYISSGNMAREGIVLHGFKAKPNSTIKIISNADSGTILNYPDSFINITTISKNLIQLGTMGVDAVCSVGEYYVGTSMIPLYMAHTKTITINSINIVGVGDLTAEEIALLSIVKRATGFSLTASNTALVSKLSGGFLDISVTIA